MTTTGDPQGATTMTTPLVCAEDHDLDPLETQPVTLVLGSQLEAGMVLLDELDLPAALLQERLPSPARSGSVSWQIEDIDDGAISVMQVHANRSLPVAAAS